MKKHLIIIIALVIFIVSTVLPISVISLSEPQAQDEEVVEKIRVINYSAEDLSTCEEEPPKTFKTNIEKATIIAEENYEMLLNMAKEALIEKYPEFAEINSEDITVSNGYSYGGCKDGSTRYGIKFKFTCGAIEELHFYEITINTIDGENFTVGQTYAHCN